MQPPPILPKDKIRDLTDEELEIWRKYALRLEQRIRREVQERRRTSAPLYRPVIDLPSL